MKNSKTDPKEKLCISGIVKDFSTISAMPIGENSSHISCEFHYSILFDTKIITI